MVRAAAMASGLIVLIVACVTGIGRAAPSVTVSVKNFLLDWESGDYAAAAAMTTGQPAMVASSLRDAYDQLGAEDLSLGMGQVSVHGANASASFYASVDLGRGGRPWNYRGHFALHRIGATWMVAWSPSVIVPGLRSGDRLAVLTTVPQRALLLDSAGRSLIERSPAVEVGVKPARVSDPRRTAAALAKVTGLAPAEADQMVGQILAAPPNAFLELIQFAPRKFERLSAKLGRVPDLSHRWVTKRLFRSAVPAITGQVGTEVAKELVEDGQPYRPGTTVGLSGLEQSYQDTLAGTATTTVIVQNSAGHRVKVLKSWPGRAGTAVRTTINGAAQRAARAALAGLGYSAAVVAIRAGTGQILAVAERQQSGTPAVDPLGGRYEPGQAFTIVPTAALLSKEPAFGADSPVPCIRKFTLGGQAFANVPAVHKLGKPEFRKAFANACGTAFAQLSELLNPNELVTAAQQFGIGAPWRLPLRPTAFTGSILKPADQIEQAADAIGTGTVLVSPLDMALAAGVVDAGSWHQPTLVTGPSGPTLTSGDKVPVKLKTQVITELQQLMAGTVSSGAARAARLPGTAVYGQVGTAPVGRQHKFRAIWFIGYRGGVAFAVLAFAHSASFDPAVQIARRFAARLPG